ncbi:hypothetical protein Cpin_6862 [Chitinophaga pinensis DSM 2588]|uniref:Uncharacterized protein n=1 Tax=Chitinophaga pinensis (strain ATCC 43595 / DSM 2588 / LMG 13176 / NBRC 15968 / NCIMB 11800 / UQM 2034) TaxID=485918 RepID=A0A979GWS6_CHIPD|nr:hypothetical protein Cpin_6862 [Chitinophaga pinensis DSM 2588]
MLANINVDKTAKVGYYVDPIVTNYLTRYSINMKLVVNALDQTEVRSLPTTQNF